LPGFGRLPERRLGLCGRLAFAPSAWLQLARSPAALCRAVHPRDVRTDRAGDGTQRRVDEACDA